MAHDDDDDLYDEEFDFVDDDDDDDDLEDDDHDDHEEASAEGSDIADEPAKEREPETRKPAPRERAPQRAERPERPARADRNNDRDERSPDRAERAERTDRTDDRPEPIEGEGAGDDEEPVDEYGRPEQTPANYVVHVYDQQKFSRTIDRPFTPEDAEAFATEFNRTSKNYGRFAVTGKNDAKPKKTLD